MATVADRSQPTKVARKWHESGTKLARAVALRGQGATGATGRRGRRDPGADPPASRPDSAITWCSSWSGCSCRSSRSSVTLRSPSFASCRSGSANIARRCGDGSTLCVSASTIVSSDQSQASGACLGCAVSRTRWSVLLVSKCGGQRTAKRWAAALSSCSTSTTAPTTARAAAGFVLTVWLAGAAPPSDLALGGLDDVSRHAVGDGVDDGLEPTLT